MKNLVLFTAFITAPIVNVALWILSWYISGGEFEQAQQTFLYTLAVSAPILSLLALITAFTIKKYKIPLIILALVLLLLTGFQLL